MARVDNWQALQVRVPDETAYAIAQVMKRNGIVNRQDWLREVIDAALAQAEKDKQK